MQRDNYIFNTKILSSRTKQNYYIKDINSKVDIIQKWKQTIDSGRIFKFNETSIRGSFINNFFVKLLGYNDLTAGNSAWNINEEVHTLLDNTKPDAVLGFFNENNADIRVVIEFKKATTDLDIKQISRKNQQSPIEQAFGYAHKYGSKCRWIIVSNFTEIRLYYSSNSLNYEQFFINELLDEEEFLRFYYLLNKENLISAKNYSIIDNLFIENEEEKRKISDSFYNDYSEIRMSILKWLIDNNQFHDNLILVEKVQKILDRIIFICFCQVKDLLPHNTLKLIFDATKLSYSNSQEKIWSHLKDLFNSIDEGNPPMNINRFNGGLFKEDKTLNSLVLPDSILSNLELFINYDFLSDLNINILGHIFEKSISDIENIKNNIMGLTSSIKDNTRKRSGIYYTPEYITSYMVEQSIGKWLCIKRKELGEEHLPNIPEDIKRISKKTKNDINDNLVFWTKYQKILSNIKVIDIACGSGAFLNKAFDYLYKEGQRVNKIINKLKGEEKQISLFDLDKKILMNNLYGVDLNKESIEITKLSLWLKTANKFSTLTTLDNNIKCGDSLMDCNSIVGEYAFNWEKEFNKIMNNGGFDIVIGNPPYLDSENMAKYLPDIREACKNKFLTAKGNWDMYVVFIEQGLNVLKTGGIISYIVPNKLIGADYTEELRKMLLNYKIIELRDYSSIEVFKEANVYPITFTLQKSVGKQDVVVEIMNSEMEVKKSKIIKSDIFYRDIYWDKYFESSHNDNYFILEKIEMNNQLGNLANICGAATVSEAYEIKKYIREYNISFDKLDFKKLINTGTIDRYVSLWGNKATRYIKDSYLEPLVFDEDLYKISVKRSKESKSEKVIIGGMNKRLECFYDYGNYLAGKSTIIVSNSELNMKYLLGLLNSNLITYFYRITFGSSTMNGGYLTISPSKIKKIPIKIPTEIQMDRVIDLVNNLIKLYTEDNRNKLILEYEKELNLLVYEIYDLSQEEFMIIEEFVKEY